MTRLIKASEFKAKCLALMDEVARTGDRGSGQHGRLLSDENGPFECSGGPKVTPLIKAVKALPGVGHSLPRRP